MGLGVICVLRVLYALIILPPCQKQYRVSSTQACKTIKLLQILNDPAMVTEVSCLHRSSLKSLSYMDVNTQWKAPQLVKLI